MTFEISTRWAYTVAIPMSRLEINICFDMRRKYFDFSLIAGRYWLSWKARVKSWWHLCWHVCSRGTWWCLTVTFDMFLCMNFLEENYFFSRPFQKWANRVNTDEALSFCDKLVGGVRSYIILHCSFCRVSNSEVMLLIFLFSYSFSICAFSSW